MLAARFVRKFGLVPAVKAANRVLRRTTAEAHRLQFEAQWHLVPNPEWFDHFIFQYWQWYVTRIR